MATVEDCDRALRKLADRLAAVDETTRNKHVVDRSLSCRVSDLGVVFTARLGGSGLHEVTQLAAHERSSSQITLTVSSEDLLSLCDGELGIAGAWASGRLKIDASVMDVIRLRNLI